MNHTIKLLELIDIYKAFHSTKGEYIFFSAINRHSIDIEIDHIMKNKYQ